MCQTVACQNVGASRFGIVAVRQRRFDEAEPILLTCYEQLEKQRGAKDVNTRRTRRWLAELYTAWDKQAQAARYR